MLSYTLTEGSSAGELVITFRGPVDEKASQVLNELLLRIARRDVVLNMEGAAYFNSLGIRAWANFVKPLTSGRKVSYENCPPDFVNQINMMPLLKDGIEIRSFFSEFFCPDCNHAQSELFDARLARAELLRAFESKECEECGSELLLDEDPNALLYFKTA